MNRSRLSRKTRMKAVSAKRCKGGTYVGKLGIERVYGKDREARRIEIGERDGWICDECKIQCDPDGNYFRPRGEWAHIGAKRNHGDKADNGRILCGSMVGRVGCHQKEHNAGGKPVPPKRG